MPRSLINDKIMNALPITLTLEQPHTYIQQKQHIQCTIINKE